MKIRGPCQGPDSTVEWNSAPHDCASLECYIVAGISTAWNTHCTYNYKQPSTPAQKHPEPTLYIIYNIYKPYTLVIFHIIIIGIWQQDWEQLLDSWHMPVIPRAPVFSCRYLSGVLFSKLVCNEHNDTEQLGIPYKLRLQIGTIWM